MTMMLAASFSQTQLFLKHTFFFSLRHFRVIIGLAFIAGLGRYIQLKGFGDIHSLTNILLEIIVEGARVLLLLYILGLADIKKGVLRIKHFLTDKEKRAQFGTVFRQHVKMYWNAIILSLIGFSIIAWLLNYCIDVIIYKTSLISFLKDKGILNPQASEWPVLLFIKNLTVIPYTLVFETLLLLWLAGRLIILKK